MVQASQISGVCTRAKVFRNTYGFGALNLKKPPDSMDFMGIRGFNDNRISQTFSSLSSPNQNLFRSTPHDSQVVFIILLLPPIIHLSLTLARLVDTG